MILIVRATDIEEGHTPAILCKDGMWRTIPLYGTYRSCAKVYKSLGHAFRRAKQVKGLVFRLTEGHEINGGFIVSRTPSKTKPGYETVNHHPWADFIVREDEHECSTSRT